MAAPTGRRRRWRSLGVRLFVSYLLVVGVGVATLLVAADALAPTFFDVRMARMMTADGSVETMVGPSSGPGPHAGMMRGGGADDVLAAAFRSALTDGLLLAGAAGVLAAAAASLFTANRIVRPIQRLAGASQRLASGRYTERVPVPGDELGDLAASFNELAQALEATERRRLELIGDVAHELRTPVATLEGYLEGLLDGVVEPSERTWVKLHDEARRLRRLVDDLQELSRAEAGQIPLTPRAVQPADLVRSAVDRLGPAFAEKGLALAVDVPAGLPAVRADEMRAVQVLTNLLTNALRYTPAPGRVQVAARPIAGGVELTVADTGVGIAAEHLPHLFERFYRVDKSRSRAQGGTGIGLTISRALVEAMGGQIRADSAGPGQGATFAFSLPVWREAAPD